MQNEKERKKLISTMKTHQTPNKYLSYIKVSFSNLNLQNDVVTPLL